MNEKYLDNICQARGLYHNGYIHLEEYIDIIEDIIIDYLKPQECEDINKKETTK